MTGFAPQYIRPNEYQQFGLPSSVDQPDIDNLVQLASVMVDEHCGRTDGDGNGSLVYSTYQHRLLIQAPGRNLLKIPMTPIVALDANTVNALAASGAVSGGYFTGVQANTVLRADGTLSALIAASGRYSYVRRDQSMAYPDLNALINPQNLVSLFGGPPPWIGIDIGNTDYDFKTGECWIPAGLQLQRYSEVILTYNSGYDPRNMPIQVKLATAALTKNLMAQGGGTTAIKSQSLGKAGFNVTLGPDIIDPSIERLLRAFMAVRGY